MDMLYVLKGGAHDGELLMHDEVESGFTFRYQDSRYSNQAAETYTITDEWEDLQDGRRARIARFAT